MQTNLADFIKHSTEGRDAEAILRACVHCGFCSATCPTYRLLGDELDGPRGRIYLIKQMLEGRPAGRDTQRHLDRCLSCGACETTCPSGVRFRRLADIGRRLTETMVRRPAAERLLRRVLIAMIPSAARLTPLLRLGQSLRPLLPTNLKRKLPARQIPGAWPTARHRRRMLILNGCIQAGATPATNAAAARVLDRFGISGIGVDGCCGALSYHLGDHTKGLATVRRNIDAWWPFINQGIEAIIVTASGCGVHVKEYGELLAHDKDYAEKAARVSALAKDFSEVLQAQDLSVLGRANARKVAFHAPCTLQHGQRLNGIVEALLRRLGFTLTAIADAHLCCGSAGAYSLLQKDLSQQLLVAKLAALGAGTPDVIATANVGCQLHLQTRSTLPVCHWIELVDALSP